MPGDHFENRNWWKLIQDIVWHKKYYSTRIFFSLNIPWPDIWTFMLSLTLLLNRNVERTNLNNWNFDIKWIKSNRLFKLKFTRKLTKNEHDNHEYSLDCDLIKRECRFVEGGPHLWNLLRASTVEFRQYILIPSNQQTV